MDNPTKRPLVIGSPRSGFSLTIQVVNSILNLHNKQFAALPDVKWRAALRGMVDLSSIYLTNLYRDIFEQHGLLKDLIFNGEFHSMVGGPKWLDQDDPSKAGVRKYFGVRGQGDFLMNTFFPREVLEYYEVIHSHADPQIWLQQEGYRDYTKIATLRNPLGIINSSSFSLNAMASEYIQRFNSENLSQDFIRQRHGLFKLSDLNFVEGLGLFYKKYFDQYLSVQDEYLCVRWEDLIQSPGKTINQLSEKMGLPVTVRQGTAIWRPMDHVNTLQHHKHNFRKGKGIVGDWKNSLVNEHFEILRDMGYNDCLNALGYPSIPDVNPNDYSPYQKLVACHIQRGDIYQNVGDMDLFGFAFNKSNIDASKFNFKSLPKRQWSHVERTTVKNDAVVEAVADAAEEGCGAVNTIFKKWIDAKSSNPADNQRLLSELKQSFISLPHTDRQRHFSNNVNTAFPAIY